MLVFVLVGGFATFVGVQAIVGQFGGTARQLAREVTITDSLRTQMLLDETDVVVSAEDAPSAPATFGGGGQVPGPCR